MPKGTYSQKPPTEDTGLEEVWEVLNEESGSQ